MTTATDILANDHAQLQSMAHKTFLITGGNGMLGRAFRGQIERLLPEATIHCLDKTQPHLLHDKANRRAMHPAAKAMIKLLGLTDGKGRGFFVMERATGDIIRTRFFKGHIALNQIHNIQTIQQILNETFWNQACSVLLIKSKISAR